MAAMSCSLKSAPTPTVLTEKACSVATDAMRPRAEGSTIPWLAMPSEIRITLPELADSDRWERRSMPCFSPAPRLVPPPAKMPLATADKALRFASVKGARAWWTRTSSA